MVKKVNSIISIISYGREYMGVSKIDWKKINRKDLSKNSFDIKDECGEYAALIDKEEVLLKGAQFTQEEMVKISKLDRLRRIEEAVYEIFPEKNSWEVSFKYFSVHNELFCMYFSDEGVW